MSKTKSSGTTTQHTTRPGKRRGLKATGGQVVKPGQIIVRQQGTKFHPGDGVRLGRDFTLYAVKAGKVNFKNKQGQQTVEVK